VSLSLGFVRVEFLVEFDVIPDKILSQSEAFSAHLKLPLGYKTLYQALQKTMSVPLQWRPALPTSASKRDIINVSICRDGSTANIEKTRLYFP
jgi:hypothetical protein